MGIDANCCTAPPGRRPDSNIRLHGTPETALSSVNAADITDGMVKEMEFGNGVGRAGMNWTERELPKLGKIQSGLYFPCIQYFHLRNCGNAVIGSSR